MLLATVAPGLVAVTADTADAWWYYNYNPAPSPEWNGVWGELNWSEQKAVECRKAGSFCRRTQQRDYSSANKKKNTCEKRNGVRNTQKRNSGSGNNSSFSSSSVWWGVGIGVVVVVLVVADGPLPIGDSIAAGIIGGGAYGW